MAATLPRVTQPPPVPASMLAAVIFALSVHLDPALLDELVALLRLWPPDAKA